MVDDCISIGLMKQLLDPVVVERTMLYLAIGGPLCGFIVGLAVGMRAHRTPQMMVGGTLIGALCSMAYVLWRLYGGITNALGLDSLVNLAVQIVIFAVVGALLGIAAHGLTEILKRHAQAWPNKECEKQED